MIRLGVPILSNMQIDLNSDAFKNFETRAYGLNQHTELFE